MNPHAFSKVGLPDRGGKPRNEGLTMMMDVGMPLTHQESLLELLSKFIDTAKVLTTTAGLIDDNVLRRKIDLYESAGVEPFPGGMFAEFAFSRGRTGRYLDACVDAGFRLVEISQNVTNAGPEGRRELVISARERGLKVIGEVGGKSTHVGTEEMVLQAKDFLTAGAWKVLVEAREFFTNGQFDSSLWSDLTREVPASDLWMELPGSWIPGVHKFQVYETMLWLIDQVGESANVANVEADDLLKLETIRRHIGPNLEV